MRLSIAICLLAGWASTTAARAADSLPVVDWLADLNDRETLSVLRLSSAEQKQILNQIEMTSFDTPDAWWQELRVRRISLGTTEAIVVRGTNLLCGATGNCETWVFRRANRQWLNMFIGEAPVVSSIGLVVDQTKGIRNIVLAAHVSASSATWTEYAFGGAFYKQVHCFDINSETNRATEVPCQRSPDREGRVVP